MTIELVSIKIDAARSELDAARHVANCAADAFTVARRVFNDADNDVASLSERLAVLTDDLRGLSAIEADSAADALPAGTNALLLAHARREAKSLASTAHHLSSTRDIVAAQSAKASHAARIAENNFHEARRAAETAMQRAVNAAALVAELVSAAKVKKTKP